MENKNRDIIDIMVELRKEISKQWFLLLTKGDEEKFLQMFTVHKSLFHYTTVPGLFGIIENECFWLTNIQYMNDLSEIRYAKNLIKDMLAQLSLKDKYVDGFSKYLNRVEEFNIEYNNYYIACFTHNGDSLPMWTMYGKDCGVAIEIDLTSEYHFVFGPNCFFEDMLYEESIFYRFIENVVDIYYAEYTKLINCKHIDECIVDGVMNELCANIVWYAHNLKNRNFSHESETRLFYRYKNDYTIKYRIKNNFIVPYVEMPPRQFNKGKKLPIKSIVVGPGEEQDLVRYSIDEFMKSKGYDIEVRLSTIPYRNR